MGQHPNSAVWEQGGGQAMRLPNRLSDEHCQFLDDNIGISRRTLRHVHIMFNNKFDTRLTWDSFMALRADAIRNGRCRTTYFRNYFKSENSSERELRIQQPLIKSRLTGGCRYKSSKMEQACGARTQGRFCEDHARAGHVTQKISVREHGYIDSSLGKYG